MAEIDGGKAVRVGSSIFLGAGIPLRIKRKNMVPKTPNKTTSAKVASVASKLLANPKTPAKVKSVAASDLAQAKKKGK